jgi:hypothetical protein
VLVKAIPSKRSAVWETKVHHAKSEQGKSSKPKPMAKARPKLAWELMRKSTKTRESPKPTTLAACAFHPKHCTPNPYRWRPPRAKVIVKICYLKR